MATRPPAPVDEWEDVNGAGEWEDVTPAAASAPETTTDPLTGRETAFHPTTARAWGMLKGGMSAVNPINLARATYELGKMGVHAVTDPYSPESLKDAENLVTGVTESGAALAGRRGAEAQGEIVGALLAPAIPVGSAAERVLPKLGFNELSRAHNIKRALRVPTGSGSAVQRLSNTIESMAPEIELPVTLSARKLADKLKARRAAAGMEVGAARRALPDASVPTESVVSTIEKPPSKRVTSVSDVVEQSPLLDERGNPIIRTRQVSSTRDIPYSESRMAQYEDSVRQLRELGSELTTEDLVQARRAAQDTAAQRGGYTTVEEKAAAHEAKKRAVALKTAVRKLGPEAEAFDDANRAFHVAKTIETPAAKEASRLSRLPLATRGTEMLLGRGFTQNPSIMGAIAGVMTGNILDSRLFHTASANIKRRVIDALQTGNARRAAQILFDSAVAENALRRRSEAALRAQGEGVTTP